jgi:DNA-binding GntR family transcriptional regulator
MLETTPSTLRVHLIQKLREDILSGKYKPGDRLNESSIAREFGISRIPVREALFELRESGLVMSHERRGMFVTSLSEEEVEKINSVRIVLETEALTLAQARMTPEIAAKLLELVIRMESTDNSLSEAAALDLAFHRAIWAAAGNDYLEKVLDPLATVLFAQYTLERVSTAHRRWRLNHHRALLDVVLGPTSQNIRAAFLTHMQAAYTESPQGPTVALKAEAAAKTQKKPPAPKKNRTQGLQGSAKKKRVVTVRKKAK